MCLWWSKREPIESSFDPRFGSAAITAPTSGAFADPSTAPPLTTAVLPSAVTSDQPPPSPPMSQTARFSNAKPASLNLVPSNRSSEISSPPQPLTSKSAQSRQSRQSQQSHISHNSIYNNTQFSNYNSTPSSPSDQLQPSPQWPKTSPGIDKPTSPVPVHQAYIPSDQLSIGSKLSPVFSNSGAPTPTTNGPRTGNSTTATMTSGWGSAQPSPTTVLSSLPSSPASSPPLPQMAQMQGISPKLQQSHQVQSIILPPVDQQQQQQHQPRLSMQRLTGIQGTQASHPQSRMRMARVALPSLKLSAVPKKKQAKTWERSPESDIEQWPGSM